MYSAVAFSGQQPCVDIGSVTVVAKLATNGEYEVKYAMFGKKLYPAILKTTKKYSSSGPIAGKLKVRRTGKRDVKGQNGFTTKVDMLEECKPNESTFEGGTG